MKTLRLTGRQLEEISLNLKKLKQEPPRPEYWVVIPHPKKNDIPFRDPEETSPFSFVKLLFEYDLRLNDYVLCLSEEF